MRTSNFNYLFHNNAGLCCRKTVFVYYSTGLKQQLDLYLLVNFLTKQEQTHMEVKNDPSPTTDISSDLKKSSNSPPTLQEGYLAPNGATVIQNRLTLRRKRSS